METMDDFSEKIVQEIEARGVTPLPRWRFLVRRSVLWTFAVLSILIGAVAFSVGNYVFFDNEGTSVASILESPIEVFVQTIPFIWLIVFGLFVASARLTLRNTRAGYRYPAVAVIFAVVAVTIGLGLVLDHFDFGQAVHSFLLGHTSFYDALIRSSDDLDPL